MISPRPARLWFEVMLSIGPLNVFTADAGPIAETVSVRTRVIVAGSAISPTIETSAFSAGNSDRTAQYVSAAAPSERLSSLNSGKPRLSVVVQEGLWR